jgi:DMSO reductase family type II enzyme chaperone
MPTPSDTPPARQWEARPTGRKRSIFGNFRDGGEAEGDAILPDEVSIATGARPSQPPDIDAAMARAFIYQFLARAFADPDEEGWAWLGESVIRQSFWSAVKTLADEPLETAALACVRGLTPDSFDAFRDDYVAAFGHAARGSVPMNEIEYGDLKADPLFQPHRLADLAAFYRAFGLEVDEAAERHDHLCIELEFMSVLAAKEAYAIQQNLDTESLAIVRDAQRDFLREHVGRWSPAFGRRLRTTADGPLAALGDLLRAFVEADCARAGVRAGSDDLLLRPVDESSERLCESCGIHNLPPGALATGAET